MIHFQDKSVTLHHGDCLDVLRGLPDASVDSVVTDPPYGLEFMGKGWDAPWQDSDVNADAGFNGGGISATKTLPSFTGSTNPKCLTCKGTRRGRRDGTAKVAVCLCVDGGRFPNVRAVEMRAFGEWCELWAAECLRVLRPGGHLLAFGGSRTYHRMTSGVEDAGFEIRDCITWHFGSGFPKSLDVSKAIDRAAPRAGMFDAFAAHFRESRAKSGLTQKDIARHFPSKTGGLTGCVWNWENGANVPTRAQWEVLAPMLRLSPEWLPLIDRVEAEREVIAERRVTDRRGDGTVVGLGHAGNADITAPATPAAAQWQGWGTALKPATEFIVVARKPLSGTVASNVTTWGTGALNIDGCRVDGGARPLIISKSEDSTGILGNGLNGSSHGGSTTAGRWPANVVLDEAMAEVLDQQSGTLTSGANPTRRGSDKFRDAYGDFKGQEECTPARGVDVGGASRFFYVAKADASERPRVPSATGKSPNAANRRCALCKRSEITGSRCECPEPQWERETPGHVSHPTVKPLALMRWLVRLVTPPGGTCLEPFAGSGTTVEACIVEGFQCIAIEREADYLPLIEARISRRRDPVRAIQLAAEDLGLFGIDLDGGAA